MVLERGRGSSVERIPDSQALIGARIDRLPPAHRSVLGEGRSAASSGPALRAPLAGHRERRRDDRRSAARDFLLPEARLSISGEVAFRFKHVLIREVAYAGCPSRRGPITMRASPAGSMSAPATS